MQAKAIPLSWRANAIALALGLAIIGLGASLAHADGKTTTPPVATQQARQQALAPDFVCHALPGAWCDLRDWRGFGLQPAPQQSALPR